jgi:autotransporter translocation and assembly factor TamB
MAVMQSRDTRTFEAGEDLSSHQFKFVTLESDGQVDAADAAGERALGVLLNKPDAAGKAATVAMTGKVMVEAGAAVTAGAQLQTNAAGEAITAAAGDVVMGYALEDAVDGQIFAMELIQGGNVVPA